VRTSSTPRPSRSTSSKPQSQDICACDFAPVVTLFFQTLYAFVILHLGQGRVVDVNATAHPTDAWVAKQLREATPFSEKSKHWIGDHDTKYGPAFHAAAKGCGLDILHTPYEAPWANAICARSIGSLRRECLDDRLVLGDRQLARVLTEHSGYFNRARPHQGLVQQAPESRQLGQANLTPAQSAGVSPSVVLGRGAAHKLGAAPVLNGLHHSYAWVT